MNIHALWCHPRSVSTAFERIMRERGDLDVLHEPFMYHHYLTQEERCFPDFAPEPGHPQTYADIREMILRRAVAQPVFFKDMAYYVDGALPDDLEFARAMTHAFLVRDPAEAIISYQKRDPDFSRKELGMEAQYALFQALRAAGLDPLVITATQLRMAPEKTLARYWAHVGLPFVDHAFGWDDKVPDDWKAVAEWHGNALSSGAIQKPEAGRDFGAEVSALGAPFVGYEAHHRPFYDALRLIAEQQAHQK
ncbi:MAG: hypothetical protein ACPGVA_12340 [Pikeienuella sp.]